MKYKAIGFVVWNGGRWYLRRRYGDAPKKVFAGGVMAALLAGAVVAQRRASSGDANSRVRWSRSAAPPAATANSRVR